MTINKTKKDTAMTLSIEGRLDTTTAPDLETVVRGEIDGITDLTFDLKNLEYISSAGLRVLLSAQRIMNKQGNMLITGCNAEIMEIFDITGFSDILTIQ